MAGHARRFRPADFLSRQDISGSGQVLRRPIVVAVSWVFTILFNLVHIYSIFIEIPFQQTYVEGGVGDELVTTGTYALTRHPGVLWMTLAMIFLVLATRSRLLAIAFPIWSLMNLGWVGLQDAFYFEKVFPGYAQYKRKRQC